MSAPRKPLTWLITGCSNGIGLALARHVLASGDNVIATSRNPSKTPSLVAEIESNLRSKWLALDGVTMATMPVGSTRCNNAAYAALGAVEGLPEDTARAQFDTNFWDSVHVFKAVLLLMRYRGRGIIVNVSSALGVTTGPGYGMYSASKFALQGT